MSILFSFSAFIEELKLVPSAFWAGAGAILGTILGAGFTLFTAGIAERRAIERARVQREHEAEEKARERTMALRREVYLPVAAEYNAALKFLSTMPNFAIEEIGKGEPLTQLSASISKLVLVSTPATALAAHKLSVECAVLYMKFAPLAMEIAGIRGLSEVHKALRDKSLSEMDEVRLSMGSILESGEPDDKRLSGLQSRFAAIKEFFELEGKKLDEVNANHHALQIKFGLQFLPGLRALLDLGMQNVVSMRQDLGQDGSLDDFAKEIRASADRVYAIAETTLDGLQGQV